MSIVRRRFICPSRNAFCPHQALWQLLLELRAVEPQRRHFSAAARQHNEVVREAPASNSSNPQDDSQADQSSLKRGAGTIKRGPHADIVNPESLSETLEAHRARNRATLIQKEEAIGKNGKFYRPKLISKTKVNRREIGEGTMLEGGRVIAYRGPKATGGQWFDHLRFDDKLADGGSNKSQKKPNSSVKANEEVAMEVMEYEGRNVLPAQIQYLNTLTLPWSVKQTSEIHGYARLSKEIRDFHQYMQPTDIERTARDDVIEDITRIVKDVLSHRKLEVIGSQRTGLASAISDLDFRLSAHDEELQEAGTDILQAPKKAVRVKLVNELRHLQARFRKEKDYIMVFLRHARYPLISMQHKHSGLDIQIVLSNDTSLSRELIQRYVTEMPALPSVYTTVKTIFDLRGLSDVYRGGFGAYSIFMMLVAALKQDKDLRPDDPARQLLYFMHFFRNLDTYKLGVCVEPPEFFPRVPPKDGVKKAPKGAREFRSVGHQILGSTLTPEKQRESEIEDGIHHLAQTDPLQPYLLALQDPADPYNDLGRKHYAIKHSQATISKLHTNLLQRLYRNQPGSVISPLVANSVVVFQSRRKMLEAWGRKVLELEEQPGDRIPEYTYGQTYTTLAGAPSGNEGEDALVERDRHDLPIVAPNEFEQFTMSKEGENSPVVGEWEEDTAHGDAQPGTGR